MRRFICSDSIPWLNENRNIGSIVTSLPDSEEIGLTIQEWSEWFYRASALCMLSASPAAVSVFYQTDRKCSGELHSKAALLFRAASDTGVHAIWHKIVLRRAVGATDIHRPGFTHMIAFTKEARPGTATPDVIERGPMAYPNSMGENAASVALTAAMRCGTRVVDPFCGRGTVPKIADALGMEALGIDIDPKQIEIASTPDLYNQWTSTND